MKLRLEYFPHNYRVIGNRRYHYPWVIQYQLEKGKHYQNESFHQIKKRALEQLKNPERIEIRIRVSQLLT